MKKILYATLITTSLTFTGCSCELLKLCNLILPSIKLINPIVSIGVSFFLEGFIQNKTEEVCNGKNNKGDAPASKESRSVEYRADASSPWYTAQFSSPTGPTEILVTNVPGIQSGGNTTQQHEFVFNTPGEYRFSGQEDYLQVVQETNETDNSNDTEKSAQNGQLSGKNDVTPIKDDGIVRVFDPTGKVKPVYNDEHTVVVQFVGVRTVATNTQLHQ